LQNTLEKIITPVFIIFFFSIFLIFISSYALLNEIKPFLGGHTSPATRFNDLETYHNGINLSIFANKKALNNCLEVLASPTGMAQPTNRRIAALSSCQKLALNITNSMPTYAYAWYIAAHASAELRQFEAFNSYILKAQNTAPNEQWLAILRVNLVENNWEHLNSKVVISQNKDLILLIKSKNGIKSIVARYIDRPSFRERITFLVETSPQEDQKRFINVVRATAEEISLARGGLANE